MIHLKRGFAFHFIYQELLSHLNFQENACFATLAQRPLQTTIIKSMPENYQTKSGAFMRECKAAVNFM